MPFEIVRNDITKMNVDAIVNTANPRPVVGYGTDSMIHKAAGPMLLQARRAIGDIKAGYAAITPAFDLQAKYVIHTVGPVWNGGSYGEEALLRNCYDNALKLALEHNCQSIAFPLISTGNYGFPKDKALQIAISAFSTFLLEHEMTIFLVVFDHTSFRLSEKLFQSVASYIDENYVDLCETAAYGTVEETRPLRIHRRRDMEQFHAGRNASLCAYSCTQNPFAGRYAETGGRRLYRNPLEADRQERQKRFADLQESQSLQAELFQNPQQSKL